MFASALGAKFDSRVFGAQSDTGIVVECSWAVASNTYAYSCGSDLLTRACAKCRRTCCMPHTALFVASTGRPAGEAIAVINATACLLLKMSTE